MKIRHLGIPRIYMGKKLLFFAVLLVACAAVAFSQAQRRPVLGILPFTGGTGGDGETIATLISIESEILRAFTVVPRTAALNAIFAEHYFQLAGLTDSDTIAGIGRMLNADYVLSGTIRQLGDRNLVIATIINVETFEQVGGYHRTYRTIEEVRDFLPSMSRNMVATALGRGGTRLPSLAMLPFTLAPGVDAQDAETLSEILAIEILNTGDYVVLPRTSTIQAALTEMDFQMLGHTDDEGMASLGRAINADMVLSAGVHRLGALNMFTAQVLRVSDGSMFAGASRDYRVITDGIELMPELAILLTDSDRARADRRIAELRRGRPSTAVTPAVAATPSATPARAAEAPRAGDGVSVPGNTLAAQMTWLRNNAESNTHYVIELTGNQNLAPQTLPTGRTGVTVTLRGSGGRRNVNLSSSGSLFTIGSGVTLVLDNNLTLVGRSRGGNGNANNDNHLIRINNGGTLIMNQGARITGNNNTLGSPWPWASHGTGVRVNNGGVFIMNGGEIIGNTATTSHGVGVLIEGGGRFNMYAGRISDNTSSSEYTGSGGGGVLVIGGGTFNMRGGTISGNRSTTTGGGVYVQSGATFRISDGIIHGNNASGDLRNRASRRSAAISNNGTAQHGTFNAAGAFTSLGSLGTNNNTVHVVNGVLR